MLPYIDLVDSLHACLLYMGAVLLLSFSNSDVQGIAVWMSIYDCVSEHN